MEDRLPEPAPESDEPTPAEEQVLALFRAAGFPHGQRRTLTVEEVERTDTAARGALQRIIATPKPPSEPRDSTNPRRKKLHWKTKSFARQFRGPNLGALATLLLLIALAVRRFLARKVG